MWVSLGQYVYEEKTYKVTISDEAYNQVAADAVMMTHIDAEPTSLTLTASAGGSTTPARGTYLYPQGSNATVTAKATIGYVFSHWTLDGEDAGGGNPVTVDMSQPHSLEAVFTPENTGDSTVPTYLLIGLALAAAFLVALRVKDHWQGRMSEK